jgi:hypothetical protein
MIQKVVPVTGVWVRREFEHLGGRLTVLVEVEGRWRALNTWAPEGHISHIYEPAGIVRAPLDPLTEPSE